MVFCKKLLASLLLLIAIILVDFVPSVESRKKGGIKIGKKKRHHKAAPPPPPPPPPQIVTSEIVMTRPLAPTTTILQTVQQVTVPRGTYTTNDSGAPFKGSSYPKSWVLMSSDRETLINFGFPEFKVDKAIKATNGSGLQAALDWLEANADNEAAFTDDVKEDPKGPQKTCLKCNQCGKKFSEMEQVELHAERTKHDDFQEAVLECNEVVEVSSEPVTPLTEEEKAQKLAELREKVSQKRAAREKEAREAELRRRTDAKELEQIRRELELKEMKKLAEERRQDKIKERQLREEIKLQIEEDRKNKKAAEEAERALRNATPGTAENVVIAAPPVTATISADHARIQVKLPPPAQALKLSFDSPKTVTLADLKTKISEAIGGKPVGDLLQTFPTRTLSSAEDGKTLFDLGLCPSASLSMK